MRLGSPPSTGLSSVSVSSSPDTSEVDRQRKRREGEKRWGRNGGGERVRSIFRETERHGGCVSELAGEVWVCVSVLGKGVCAPGASEEGWRPMGGCRQEAAGEEERQLPERSCPAFCLCLRARNPRS